ncbi:hypothetical protein JX265_013358 [Neoarthrinium moseri]|uniref:Uncharacterized protein n=1 Tax=Neoarthrinium moseri TaxID=1658444 RepID=A0A9Q0AG07_9PEZI|nr:uncharacterized protein JN550_012206 [Neoarthrinium moseri]KAI1847233.1 hypothetical protein JX266_006773 [Neoarthrinium moseri]KAI1850795.1 hypothetical protein JX265_013358 [Neoarthrinium moseri]KAI1859193.1 hypothetical protein JN550_012206 [Neoarthrinium moseri]
MVEGVDIQSFLQNGYWQNSRVKTPDSRFSPSYSHNNDISVPRSSHSTTYPPELRRHGFRPPAPTVEDEAESLAKEHGSVVSCPPEEEPKHPGDVDQYPILELLHEHNPERRFVLVPNSPVSPVSPSDQSQDEVSKPAKPTQESKELRPENKDTYEANTGRKYVLLSPDDDELGRKRDREDREKRPNRERRKSKLEDLPAIVTDLGHNNRDEPKRGDVRRAKSATGAEPGSEDYFSPRRSSQRLREESMLSPDVIKHSTKGRDRAYYDYSGSSTPNQGRARANQAEDKRQPKKADGKESRAYSSSPVDPKKSSNFDPPRNVRRTSKEGPPGREKDYYDKGRESSSKLSRKNSTSNSRSDRESLRPRSASFRGKRDSPPYEDSRYSSDEDTDRRGVSRRRGKSSVREERKGYLSTPVETKPLDRRSKPSTPLASPRASQGDFRTDLPPKDLSRSPRSATFPTSMDLPKTEPRQPAAAEDSPTRPLSRASTARSTLNSAASLALPVITATAASAAQDTGTPVDRRPAGVPPPPKGARAMPEPRGDSRSSVPTPVSSPPKQSWQPPKFDPSKDSTQLEQPVTSYRRYSESRNIGDASELADCPRMKPEAGHVDWLTLFKTNFSICPTCYQSAFGNSQFRNDFVPAPLRPLDRPFKCDFGTSLWCHIAWLLTQKYNKPDLRLFHGLVNVTASHQPCSGLQPAYRIWYTIKDPVTQRPVRNFNICHHCAKSIEVLLPNLSGAFVPMDSPAEPTKGTCSMHQHGFGGVRRRFVLFFDQLEATSDVALATSCAPDIRLLADRVREIAITDECYGSQPVANRRWHTMRSVPDFTVCEECFNEVIWPEIERDSSGIQADFYKNPQKIPVAACQLYSDRMRSVFHKAVENDDLDLFRSRIRRRQQKEREFHSKVRGLDVNALGKEWVEEEIERLKKEWSRYE